MKRKSSRRRTDWPIPVFIESPLLVLWSGCPARLKCSHGACARRNGLDDVVVPRAAAQIAFELLANRPLVEFRTLAVHNIDGGQDHAGRAETALERMMLAEGFLHRMELAVRCESFDRGHLGAFARH